ncbi:hypothetical protein [Pandoraea apista]|uniref:hypothetical protein n=1 Tax=Pandoraea apista TaxID=93218 RepID=UPI001C8BED93|nr:hypothetical protein [Pandoraea apista]
MDIDKRVTTIETLLPTLMTRADGEVLRADLHRLDASIKTWMIATILALFFGFAGLFFTMSNSLKGAPTATQAPVIITIPQAPAPPQAASK